MRGGRGAARGAAEQQARFIRRVRRLHPDVLGGIGCCALAHALTQVFIHLFETVQNPAVAPAQACVGLY